MINRADLIEAGYVAHYEMNRAADDTLYLKHINKLNTRFYTINIRLYDYDKHLGRGRAPRPTGITANVRFYSGDALTGSSGFDVNPLVERDATLAGLEDWFARVYMSLNCIPDMHNQP